MKMNIGVDADMNMDMDKIRKFDTDTQLDTDSDTDMDTDADTDIDTAPPGHLNYELLRYTSRTPKVVLISSITRNKNTFT
jgi:hypothetical protein